MARADESLVMAAEDAAARARQVTCTQARAAKAERERDVTAARLQRTEALLEASDAEVSRLTEDLAAEESRAKRREKLLADQLRARDARPGVFYSRRASRRGRCLDEAAATRVEGRRRPRRARIPTP